MIKMAWDRVTRNSGLRAFLASIFIGAACFAFAADGGTNITVSGWVIDSACAYTKGLENDGRKKPESEDGKMSLNPLVEQSSFGGTVLCLGGPGFAQ